MATFIKVNDWITHLLGDADPASDTFRVALSNTAPASEASNPLLDGNGVLANVTQIDYANYTDDLAVDRTLEGISFAFSGGVYTFTADGFTITPSGGAIAAFRYFYIYDDTLAGDPLVAVWDIGVSLALSEGFTAPVQISGLGLFTVQ